MMHLPLKLSKFCRYKLFDANDIVGIKEENVQGQFKIWFHKHYPLSPYVKIKARETYSLQL
jgi:hypothetical protein